jgi:hypothetical protein
MTRFKVTEKLETLLEDKLGCQCLRREGVNACLAGRR